MTSGRVFSSSNPVFAPADYDTLAPLVRRSKPREMPLLVGSGVPFAEHPYYEYSQDQSHDGLGEIVCRNCGHDALLCIYFSWAGGNAGWEMRLEFVCPECGHFLQYHFED